MKEKKVFIIKNTNNSNVNNVSDFYEIETLLEDKSKITAQTNMTIERMVYTKSPTGSTELIPESEIRGTSSAEETTYDNSASELDATNVQEAVDEVQGNIEQEATDRQLAIELAIETAGFASRTGTAIAFDKWATYGTYDSPVSGNLSYSFTNMVKGMIQVMYHEDTVAPTITDVGVTVIETGDYVVGNVNKITVHCIDENIVEVNIKAL